MKKSILILILITLWIKPCPAELLMHTHGYMSFAPYVNGIKKTEGLYPAYRAEFIAHVDFVKRNNLIVSGLVGNKTMISQTETSIFNWIKFVILFLPDFGMNLTDG